MNEFELYLSEPFQNLSIMLAYHKTKFLSIELNHALDANKGADTKVLTEMLMSRSNHELAEVRAFYEESTFYNLHLMRYI